MKFGLRIKPEDCSLLGQEILKYMESTGLSMRKFASQAGITHPGLRVIILKGGNPTESNIIKLARVMNRHPMELYQLVYEDKLRATAEPGAIDVLVRAFDEMLEAFLKLAGQLPEDKRPSEYELLDKTLKTIKSFQEETQQMSS